MENSKEVAKIVAKTEVEIVDKRKKNWERKLHKLNLYHGTSVENAEKILQRGIQPNEKPYSNEDQAFIEDELRKRGKDLGRYADGKDKEFYIEGSNLGNDGTLFDGPVGYAVAGSEMIRYYLLPWTRELETMVRKEMDGGLDRAEDYQRIVEIREKYLKNIYEHRPALLRIKRGSETYKKLLELRLPESWRGVMDSYESFTKVVEEIQSENEMSRDEAENYVTEVVIGRFFNLAVKEEIKVQDLELIEGEDFDQLNEKTKEIAKLREYCFGVDKRQVPELLEMLSMVAKFDAHSLDVIVNVARSYGISKEDAEKFYLRAKELQKEN